MCWIEEPEKEKLLEENNYIYSGQTLCFVNHDTGKIFTSAYVNDHPLDTIQNKIHETHKPTVWKIYRNREQTGSIQNILFEHGEKPLKNR